MNSFYQWGRRAALEKYAALVVPTKVHESKIEGKGLFAAKDLSKGETVWRFDPKVDKDLTRKQVEASSPERQKYLDTYASRVGDTFTLAGDDAKYMNHSEHANLKTQHSGEAPMKTTRPVRKGEELTANYREFDDDAREGKLNYVKSAAHTWTGPGGQLYDVKKLWDLAKESPVAEVPLDERIAGRKVTELLSGGGDAERLENADLSYPILLSPEGHRVDGNHRIAKALRQGLTSLPAQKLTPEQMAQAVLEKTAGFFLAFA